MSFLQKLISGVTRLNDVIGRWIALLVFVMSALLLLEVVCRYLLKFYPTKSRCFFWRGSRNALLIESLPI